ncbi:MAG: DUF4440 domain-containing protein, partial [Saccharothrix sp.]|nr:DUF4440 domain-containing protein [Saccharothrix sp.]
LASRARRRVRSGTPVPDDLSRQREVVSAFMAAARGGDFDALLAVLDPDVVLRVDFGALKPDRPAVVRGAAAVASQAIMFSSLERQGRQVLVDGGLALLSTQDGEPKSLLGMTVSGGRIVAMHVLADPDRVRDLELTELEPTGLEPTDREPTELEDGLEDGLEVTGS